MTSQQVPADDVVYEYSGFWVRFGAAVVDALIVLLITSPLLFWQQQPADFESMTLLTWEDLLLEAVTVIFTIGFWLTNNATPGKMLFNLKVLDEKTGKPITLKQAVLRYIGYLLSAIPLMLGYFWVVFDTKKQGWHDKIAKTVVVKQIC